MLQLHAQVQEVTTDAALRAKADELLTEVKHKVVVAAERKVTTAVKRGVNLMKVCDQTGHKSLEMLRVYSRDAELFAGNAAAGLL